MVPNWRQPQHKWEKAESLVHNVCLTGGWPLGWCCTQPKFPFWGERIIFLRQPKICFSLPYFWRVFPAEGNDWLETSRSPPPLAVRADAFSWHMCVGHSSVSDFTSVQSPSFRAIFLFASTMAPKIHCGNLWMNRVKHLAYTFSSEGEKNKKKSFFLPPPPPLYPAEEGGVVGVCLSFNHQPALLLSPSSTQKNNKKRPSNAHTGSTCFRDVHLADSLLYPSKRFLHTHTLYSKKKKPLD